jgi:glycosyltransferase involved in cell wall biosynthesis
MRIGLIAPPWFPVPPSGYGGIEDVVDNLARGFSQAGHEVLLAAATDSRCPVPLVAGMQASDPGGVGDDWSGLLHVVRAYEAMDGMDIIHDHTLAGPLCAERPASIPVVTTVHGPLTPALAEIYRAAARHVAVVGISRRQVAEGCVPIASVIHHGIDIPAIPVGPGTGGYACFLGRMCPDKGVAQAIAIARSAGIPLKIAAKMREPGELEYFHNVIEPMLGSNEEFLGEVAGRDKYRLLGDALALLNPIQWTEPFGLVMVEALATGTPVVGTPRGAAPEIVDSGKTGYLAHAMAELARLLPKAALLDRRACRGAAERRFSAARMVADHLNLYSALLEEFHAGPPEPQGEWAPAARSGAVPGRPSP